MPDLIIVGGGPAGLTAALYAARSRMDTVIFEKLSLGGRIMMTESIENFPGFPGGINSGKLIANMQEQVKELGVKIEFKEIIGIEAKDKKIIASDASYSAKSVIIASGAKPRKINVPGEEEFTGKGVSYCAVCDAPFFKGKDVFLIGGGNAVAEEALYLARFVSRVNIVHRRNDLRASEILQEKLKRNKKINFILSSVVSQIIGDMKVRQIKIRNLKNEKEEILSCDGVFVYIGYDPETGFLKNKMILDEKGFIITDESMKTSAEGIFACGDCRKKSLYQVVTACADGAIAADSAYKYVSVKEK